MQGPGDSLRGHPKLAEFGHLRGQPLVEGRCLGGPDGDSGGDLAGGSNWLQPGPPDLVRASCCEMRIRVQVISVVIAMLLSVAPPVGSAAEAPVEGVMSSVAHVEDVTTVLAFSHDGRQFLFCDSAMQLIAYDLSTQRRQVLSPLPGCAKPAEKGLYDPIGSDRQDRLALWSPDDRRVLFLDGTVLKIVERATEEIFDVGTLKDVQSVLRSVTPVRYNFLGPDHMIFRGQPQPDRTVDTTHVSPDGWTLRMDVATFDYTVVDLRDRTTHHFQDRLLDLGGAWSPTEGGLVHVWTRPEQESVLECVIAGAVPSERMEALQQECAQITEDTSKPLADGAYSVRQHTSTVERSVLYHTTISPDGGVVFREPDVASLPRQRGALSHRGYQLMDDPETLDLDRIQRGPWTVASAPWNISWATETIHVFEEEDVASMKRDLVFLDAQTSQEVNRLEDVVRTVRLAPGVWPAPDGTTGAVEFRSGWIMKLTQVPWPPMPIYIRSTSTDNIALIFPEGTAEKVFTIPDTAGSIVKVSWSGDSTTLYVVIQQAPSDVSIQSRQDITIYELRVSDLKHTI